MLLEADAAELDVLPRGHVRAAHLGPQVAVVFGVVLFDLLGQDLPLRGGQLPVVDAQTPPATAQLGQSMEGGGWSVEGWFDEAMTPGSRS
eukprot:384111-Rhodomonas_salina.4